MVGGGDYSSADRTVRLKKSGSVSVSVRGDRVAEFTEFFRVRPYAVTGGTFVITPGLVVIVDDDTP
jgi:hypothetical protein